MPLQNTLLGGLPLSKLALGSNPGKQLSAVVIHVLPQDHSRCHQCAVVCDHEERAVALSLYAYRGALQLGDSVDIYDPTILRVEVEQPDARQAGVRVAFHLLRVEAPGTQMKLRPH